MSVGVGDILKVVAILSWLDSDVVQNVFNAVIGGSGGPFDEDDIVDDALDWVETMYANIVANGSDEIDGSEIRVYIYDPIDDDWDEIGSEAWVFNPSDTAEQLPRGVAALINAKTTNPDVNGKKYLGGLTEGSSVDGQWGAGPIAAFANFAADWLAPFVGAVSTADWIPGIWSPTRTNFFPSSLTAIIPTVAAYQRRRKRGVGI